MNKLINQTLILEHVEYRGLVFKAYILNNTINGNQMPDKIVIHKIFITCKGVITKKQAINGLCSYFNHDNVDKDQFMRSLLESSTSYKEIVEKISAESKMAELDRQLFDEVVNLSENDIIIL